MWKGVLLVDAVEVLVFSQCLWIVWTELCYSGHAREVLTDKKQGDACGINQYYREMYPFTPPMWAVIGFFSTVSMMKVQSFDASSEFGVLQRSNTLLSLSASTHCWTFYRYTHISTSGMHWCSKIKFVNIWNIAPIQFIESANPMFFFFLRPLIDQCRTSSTHAVIKAWSGKLFQDTHARVSMFMMTEGQVYVSTSAGSSLHFLPGMIQMNTQKCTLPESLTLTSVDNLTSVL